MITNVTARYMRKVQLAQYEPHEAEATVMAAVPEGANENEVLAQAMTKARGVVLGALGLVPKSQEPSGATAGTDKPVVPASEPAPAAETKRGPGRPRKSEPAVEPATDAEKAAIAAREGAAPAPAADPADMSAMEIPANLRRAPKTEAELMAELDGPAEEKAEAPVTEQEMQRAASKAATALGDAAAIKKLMKDKYKVARLGEIAEKERRAFCKDLDNLVEQQKKSKPA